MLCGDGWLWMLNGMYLLHIFFKKKSMSGHVFITVTWILENENICVGWAGRHVCMHAALVIIISWVLFFMVILWIFLVRRNDISIPVFFLGVGKEKSIPIGIIPYQAYRLINPWRTHKLLSRFRLCTNSKSYPVGRKYCPPNAQA
jgi:hypothetical protein